MDFDLVNRGCELICDEAFDLYFGPLFVPVRDPNLP